MRDYRISTAKGRMVRGSNFDLAVRDYVWDRDKGLCVYCGSTGSHVDHVLPRLHGGPAIRENAVLACNHCNKKKGGALVESQDFITRAFYHLLSKGESLQWIDDFDPDEAWGYSLQ